jgi:hypothetical protein
MFYIDVSLSKQNNADFTIYNGVIESFYTTHSLLDDSTISYKRTKKEVDI